MRENGPPFVALIIVVLAALAAAQLLLVALVLVLAEIMGSIVIPSLLVGAFMLLLGVVVYRLALRDSVREIHERLGRNPCEPGLPCGRADDRRHLGGAFWQFFLP